MENWIEVGEFDRGTNRNDQNVVLEATPKLLHLSGCGRSRTFGPAGLKPDRSMVESALFLKGRRCFDGDSAQIVDGGADAFSV